MEVHKGKSVLKVDKYLGCCIPSPELEFLLESQGIQNYESFIDPEFNFKHGICNNEGVISEIFSPDIKGDHFNPYIRFKSCISSSSRSCSTLMDLVGLEIVPEFQHDNIFLDVVCTFPYSVDRFLLDPGYRPILIKRFNKCRKEFFYKLHELFINSPYPSELTRVTYSESGKSRDQQISVIGQLLGMSSSLHPWSTEIPILPHAHTHNIIPFFSYLNNVTRDPDFFDNLNYFDIGLSNLEDYVDPVFAEVDVTPRNSNKPFESKGSINKSKTKINNFKKVTRSESIGPIGDRKTVKVTSEESNIVKRFVVDRDKYKKLRLHISNLLKSDLGFSQCQWLNSNCPVDIDKLKDLWSDIVYTEFQDIMDNWELLDIHISWIPWYKKAKLRSALQYKIRPPVLDLDLFFKKCPGVVTNYNKLDIAKVLDFIQYQLDIAIKCSDIDKINRYESLLKKAESTFDNYSESDFYSWLQFLSTLITDTRVYGFWKNLKTYLLDPEHELLVQEEVCPICNGVFTDTSIKTKYCNANYVLIQSQNKFLVHDVKGPPLEVD